MDRETLLQRLIEAETVINDLHGCVDGYYIDSGHYSIESHERYDSKWKPDTEPLDSLNGLTDDPMDQAKSHRLRMDDLDNHFNDDPYNY